MLRGLHGLRFLLAAFLQAEEVFPVRVRIGVTMSRRKEVRFELFDTTIAMSPDEARHYARVIVNGLVDAPRCVDAPARTLATILIESAEAGEGLSPHGLH